MDRALLDTDVILDFFFDRQLYAEYSSQVIGLCETHKIKGFVTPVIYSNVYYLLSRNAKQDKVINSLKQLLSITEVLTMDKEVVKNALNSGFKDFEDSLQNFAAMNHGGVDVILTRNLKDYSSSEIGVMTPESYIKSIIASRQ